MTDIMSRLKFVEQFRPYVVDEDALARMRVDLHDLIEASEWLLDEIKQRDSGLMTPDELETFLINLDVHYVRHVFFHLRSLRKDINASLKNFPVD